MFNTAAYVEGIWIEGGKYVFGKRTRYKIQSYNGTGTSSVVEGKPASGGGWATREDAEAAAARANAGDESGIEFACYADD